MERKQKNLIVRVKYKDYLAYDTCDALWDASKPVKIGDEVILKIKGERYKLITELGIVVGIYIAPLPASFYHMVAEPT